MTWDASIPLTDHLPDPQTRMALLSEAQKAAVIEDKARWHLAHQLVTTKSEHEIRRWLAEQGPVYRADMARRLNKKTGRKNP